MLKLIIPLLMTFTVFAGQIGVVSAPYDFESSPEYQAIMTQLKPFGKFSKKTFENKVIKTKPVTLSRGQQLVEEAKARNRAILAAQKQQVDVSQDKDVLDQWKQEVKSTQDGWKQEVIDQRKRWQKEQELFLGRLKEYQENTFIIPAKIQKIEETIVTVNELPKTHIVNKAFNIPIKDQRNRPTCSAFAGIRAIEIVLNQNNLNYDLSEQYLYWASKPTCRISPCSEKGSWIPHGLKYSQSRTVVDIPLEDYCPYESTARINNETQLPLNSKCHTGKTKVLEFEEVLSLSEVVKKIRQDVPVIMAAKLSQNYFKNFGLVTLSDSSKDFGIKSSHSLGHAFLGVGAIELPEKLHAKEGTFCIVIANSWGKGWGAGGYSCLTEKWLLKYRQPSPFTAITKLSI